MPPAVPAKFVFIAAPHHTDASFKDPAGRYSMLHAKVIPPVPADTEFAERSRGRRFRLVTHTDL